MSQSFRPLVAVIGTTGTGKSQLGIELALQLQTRHTNGAASRWRGAKVINADAMQVYRGLDIATNKVTEEEKQGVEHLLMDIRHPGEEYYVSQWVKDAIQEIDACHAEQKVPILVGGTTYWIQHLIFSNRLTSLEDSSSSPHRADVPEPSPAIQEAVAALPPNLLDLYTALPDRSSSESCSTERSFELHSLLSLLDPPMGARWHWRDTRKILRSLEIIKETGMRASDVMLSQDVEAGKPRYPTLVFWLYADPAHLNSRLDARVEKMIDRGLLYEIVSMRQLAVPNDGVDSTNISIDYTQGIYQTIGFKEFDAYLSSTDEKSSELLKQSLDQMKLSTRKYAQRQVKWIQNKLLPAVRAQADGTDRASLFVLDATDLQDWKANVFDGGQTLLSKFLNGESLPDPHTLSDSAEMMLGKETKLLDSAGVLKARRRIICEACTTDPGQPVMIEEGREWQAHAKSKAHQSRTGRERRMEAQMQRREAVQRERATLRGSPPPAES